MTDTTADLAFPLILTVLRRAAEGSELVRHGRWTIADPWALWGRALPDASPHLRIVANLGVPASTPSTWPPRRRAASG